MFSAVLLLLCFYDSFSFVIRTYPKSRIPVHTSLVNPHNGAALSRLEFSHRQSFLKASTKSIEKSPKNKPPPIIRFLRNVTSLILQIIVSPFKFIIRKIFGNRPKTIVPEPVISKTVKAVAISPDLQVEEAYIKKQETAAYRKNSDNIAFAKKTIEKQLKALDMSKKAALSKPAASVSTPIVIESQPSNNISPIEIVNDIKEKVENAFGEVESFISGVKTNDDEPIKGVIVSNVPIRETVTDEAMAASVESATAVVTKLYTDSADADPDADFTPLVMEQSEIETEIETEIEIEADISTATESLANTEIPVMAIVFDVKEESAINSMEIGPYDVYSVKATNLELVIREVKQSLNEQFALFMKEWKEYLKSSKNRNASLQFADILDSLKLNLNKKAV